jgi:hypothetical protein
VSLLSKPNSNNTPLGEHLENNGEVVYPNLIRNKFRNHAYMNKLETNYPEILYLVFAVP